MTTNTTNTTEQSTKPIYDDKVNAYLQALAEGKTREEIAAAEGNNSWKSVDMYMRRRNFQWDAHRQTYVPRAVETVKAVEWQAVDSSKAGTVIALLKKDTSHPKQVAHRVGFKDHKEMAQYMQARGYEWSTEKNNYVKLIGLVSPEEQETITSQQLERQETIAALSNPESTDLARYLPLLELLSKNKERLLDLILPQTQVSTIPRYVVPGIATTKTIHMMNTLVQLVADFSHEKNITQREIFEVALIEFFKKYGFENEMERLLGQ